MSRAREGSIIAMEGPEGTGKPRTGFEVSD